MVSIPKFREDVQLSARAVLVLKVAACVAMLIDHVDWLLLDGALWFHSTLGRVVFPAFAYVIALNLGRAEPQHMLRRVVPRMLAVGVVAQLAYGALVEWQGPLNIMFSLALAVAVVSWYREGRRVRAVLAALLLGGLVDYQWWGVGLIALYAYWRGRGVPVWWYGVAAGLLLLPINGNLWALLLAPALVLVSRLEGPAPRYKWLFYAFYPLHLYALAAMI